MVTDTLVNSFVRPLTGPVSFGMICGGELKFYTSELVQGMPEFGDKEFVSIGNNFFRQSILAVPVIEEQKSQLFCGDVYLGGHNSNIGPQTVSHRQNAIEVFVKR
jgi:hypothetical protein